MIGCPNCSAELLYGRGNIVLYCFPMEPMFTHFDITCLNCRHTHSVYNLQDKVAEFVRMGFNGYIGMASEQTKYQYYQAMVGRNLTPEEEADVTKFVDNIDHLLDV